MRKQDFINILKHESIDYKVKAYNDIISVLGDGYRNVFLTKLRSLPENVQFNNGGYVYLLSLKSLPESTQFNNSTYTYLYQLKFLPENTLFNNGGAVFLPLLEYLPKSTLFNNGGSIELKSLKSLPINFQFNNGGTVNLNSLKSLPENIQFNNGGSVYLGSLTSVPKSAQFNNGGTVYLKGNLFIPKNMNVNPFISKSIPKRKNEVKINTEVKDLYKILSKFFEYNYPVYSGSSITCLECKSEYWLTGREFKANIDNGLKKVFIHKSSCMTHDKLMKEIN